MKRNDWILVAVIVLLAGIGLVAYHSFGKQDANMFVVTVKGQVYGTYSLKKDREIYINDTNVLVVKDGTADMITADCPDQICVEHRCISKSGETIVCLPNQVIVEIVGGKGSDTDAVTN